MEKEYFIIQLKDGLSYVKDKHEATDKILKAKKFSKINIAEEFMFDFPLVYEEFRVLKVNLSIKTEIVNDSNWR